MPPPTDTAISANVRRNRLSGENKRVRSTRREQNGVRSHNITFWSFAESPRFSIWQVHVVSPPRLLPTKYSFKLIKSIADSLRRIGGRRSKASRGKARLAARRVKALRAGEGSLRLQVQGSKLKNICVHLCASVAD
jgi:hypothetical protein